MRIRSRSGDEHAPEANPVFHHPGQRGFRLIELEGLRARANARQRAERHRLFGIDRASARPARHGPSAQERKGRYGQRLERRGDEEQLSARLEPVDGAGDGGAMRRGGEDHVRSAELLQPFGRGDLLGVHVLVRSQVPGQVLLVGAARDGDGAEAHVGGELEREVAEAADSLHGHRVSRPGAAVAKRVVGGDAGAEERGRLERGELVRNARHRFGGRHHVLGVPAVVADSGDLRLLAIDEEPLPAGRASEAVAAVPTDAHALAGLPSGHPGPDGVDASGDLVPGHARQLEPGEGASLDHRVAVTDATCLDLDADLSRSRLGDLPVHQLERCPGLRNLDGLHGRHRSSCLPSITKGFRLQARVARAMLRHPMEVGIPLVAELKRRRVFRALVSYGIAAFAVLQIIEPVMHGLHWSEAVLSYVVAGLAGGFPVVVALAWIFDVNSGRIERTAPGSLRGARAGMILAAIALLAASPMVVWYFVHRARTAESPAATSGAAPGASIAVLPLVNLSSDKEQEYFSDGLSEELLNLLAKVPNLRVAARTSTFAFKGKNEDVSTIAQKLHVATVLEGSVRKAGDQIRITTQLVNAKDGYHLWSETYDRKFTDVFMVQDEIAQAVVAALKLKLLQPPTSKERRTANTEAYNQYLLGQQFLRRNNVDGFRRSKQALEKAVELDPSYAPAWAALALAMFWVADASE